MTVDESDLFDLSVPRDLSGACLHDLTGQPWRLALAVQEGARRRRTAASWWARAWGRLRRIVAPAPHQAAERPGLRVLLPEPPPLEGLERAEDYDDAVLRGPASVPELVERLGNLRVAAQAGGEPDLARCLGAVTLLWLHGEAAWVGQSLQGLVVHVQQPQDEERVH